VRAEFGSRPRWLDDLWPALEPTGRARERLLEAAKHGVVVTTGQQPGLFGGPIYTWSKAIGVLALADALQEASGMPVAPLFWAATDDADFAEASTTWVAVPGGVEALTAVPVSRAGTVLAEAVLGQVTAPLARLVDAAGSAPHPAAVEAVLHAYGGRLGETRTTRLTAGRAYVTLLRTLLEPLGIGVLDAAHPAVRRQAFPTLRRALERAPEVERALERRTEAIADAGYTPQVSNVPGLSLVFAWETPAGDVGGPSIDGQDGANGSLAGASKARIPIGRAREAAARAEPGSLSHNVLLRPVVERTLVPSVAYLAGPSEFAYFAQTSAVAQALDLAPPLPVPRWACTLIEPATAALLAHYDLDIEELADPHAPEGRVARAALPTDLREALEQLMEAVDSACRAVAAADPTGLVPRATVEGTRAQLRHRVHRLERRYLAFAKRSEVDAMRDLATLRGALHPLDTRQERVLNFIPFLARGGPALLDAMQREAGRHASMLVGGAPSPHP
jgi:bacillithiol biosynthesis cysteine-adding enzyme BshC